MKNKKNIVSFFISICFTTNICASNIDSLTIYPNPCDTLTALSFTTTANDTVTLDLINVIGLTQHVFFNLTVLPAGNYAINYNTTLVPSGVYVVRLKINNKQCVKKLIVQHIAVGLISNTMQPSQIKAFPTPTQKTLTIESDELKHLQLYNVNGKLVYETRTLSNQIDISTIANGIYFLTVYTNQHIIIQHQKIIKNE